MKKDKYSKITLTRKVIAILEINESKYTSSSDISFE